MALKGHTCVDRRHAATVVHDLYQRSTGILEIDADISGSGIDGILHEFLDHRGRALYHLACGDLIGHGVG